MRRCIQSWPISTLVIALVVSAAPLADAGVLGTAERGGYAGAGNPGTIFTNPSGMLLSELTMVMANAIFIVSPRVLDFDPAPDKHTGAASREQGQTLWFPALPTLAVSSRFASKGGQGPLPLAFGLGFTQSHGGTLRFDEQVVRPGIYAADLRLWEIVPAVAYRVSSKLDLGLALRIGFGRFSSSSNQGGVDFWGRPAAPFDIEADSVTVGATMGATFKPLPWLRLGAVYGSPMNVEFKGSGRVEVTDNWREDNFKTVYPLPQWAGMGASVALAPMVSLSANLRWTDWSAFNQRVITFTRISDKVDTWDYVDGISTSLEFSAFFLPAKWNRGLAFGLNASLSYDSNVVPDKSMERYQFDTEKIGTSFSLMLPVSMNLIVVMGFAAIIGFEREVPDAVQMRVDPVTKLEEEVHLNPSPGTYSYRILATHLGLLFRY